MTVRTQRLLTVAAAVAAALAVWALAALFGLDPRTPAMGDEAPAALPASQVVVASAVAALAGWGALALLERFTRSPLRTWTVVAIGVAIVSLGAPLTGAGIDAADRAVLTALHVVVAAVLVPGLRLASPRSRPEPREARRRAGEVAA